MENKWGDAIYDVKVKTYKQWSDGFERGSLGEAILSRGSVENKGRPSRGGWHEHRLRSQERGKKPSCRSLKECPLESYVPPCQRAHTL